MSEEMKQLFRDRSQHVNTVLMELSGHRRQIRRGLRLALRMLKHVAMALRTMEQAMREVAELLGELTDAVDVEEAALTRLQSASELELREIVDRWRN